MHDGLASKSRPVDAAKPPEVATRRGPQFRVTRNTNEEDLGVRATVGDWVGDGVGAS